MNIYREAFAELGQLKGGESGTPESTADVMKCFGWLHSIGHMIQEAVADSDSTFHRSLWRAAVSNPGLETSEKTVRVLYITLKPRFRTSLLKWGKRSVVIVS